MDSRHTLQPEDRSHRSWHWLRGLSFLPSRDSKRTSCALSAPPAAPPLRLPISVTHDDTQSSRWRAASSA
jgi:hypothetical protein